MTRLELLRRRLGLDGFSPSGSGRLKPSPVKHRPSLDRGDAAMPFTGRGICIHE
jgi:hypothetical protein